MSDTVIHVQNLGKKYILRHRTEKYTALRDVISNRVRSLKNLGRRSPSSSENSRREVFWALKDVSFGVAAGEVIGIIGRNGAGKSTLLKMLSRITEPSIGSIYLKGRVASLLEVGTGFHQELTGRENIFLNGSILGMSKGEISKKFDEIVGFAEVERFLDTPVKHYSSGMYMRLAFAVAAHLESEILVIDEVLAVGDVNFQKKCLKKMEDISSHSGRTILFVSHNMGAIKSLCTSAMLLDQGNLLQQGSVETIIDRYLSINALDQYSEGQKIWDVLDSAPGSPEVRLKAIKVLNTEGNVQTSFEPHEPIAVEISYQVLEKLQGMRLTVEILNSEGVMILASTDQNARPPKAEEGIYVSTCEIPGNLFKSGLYYIAIAIDCPGDKVLLYDETFVSFFVEAAGQHGSFLDEKWPGIISPKLNWALFYEGCPMT